MTTTALRQDIGQIKPGQTVRVYQVYEIDEKGKERVQMYEGMVIAAKHGTEVGATITVRKISHGVGVEKIFPIHAPNLKKIEVVKSAKVRRAKLYFVRKDKTARKWQEVKKTIDI